MAADYTRNSEGALVFSDFVDDGAGEYLMTRRYYGYTVREARAMFREECARIAA